jgi:hypothetical protein
MRRVAAILIVIFLAFPLLSAALLAISLSTWTMDRGFYLGILGDSRLYEVPDAVSSATWSSAAIEGTDGLQWRSVGRAARVVLTPEYLRSQAVRVVNEVFDFFDGRSSRFDLTIDAAPAKAALRGEAGRRFARLLAEDLPVGGSRESFRVTPGHLPVSRPSSISVDQAASIIQAGIPAFLGSIPDTVRLSDAPSVHLDDLQGGPRLHIFGWLLAAGIIILLFGAGFLTAAAFVGGETTRERIQWYGWPLLVPAAGTLLAGLLVIAGISTPWVQWGLANAHLGVSGFSASFVAAVAEAARRVATRVGIGFLATGGIAAGVALGLLAWSWSLPRGGDGGATVARAGAARGETVPAGATPAEVPRKGETA